MKVYELSANIPTPVIVTLDGHGRMLYAIV